MFSFSVYTQDCLSCDDDDDVTATFYDKEFERLAKMMACEVIRNLGGDCDASKEANSQLQSNMKSGHVKTHCGGCKKGCCVETTNGNFSDSY